jgi:hypothetical protein
MSAANMPVAAGKVLPTADDMADIRRNDWIRPLNIPAPFPKLFYAKAGPNQTAVEAANAAQKPIWTGKFLKGDV